MTERIRFARRAEEEGPHRVRYLVRVPFAWAAFWILRGVDIMLRALLRAVWRALRHVGVVMLDRPCPRCGESLWRGLDGCSCRLVMQNYMSEFELPEGAEVIDGRIRYPVKLRRDLFHWGRMHEFFADGVVDSLRHDDNLYDALPQRERSRFL